MLNHVHEWISSLNTNMFFAGIMMLTLNIGSRYIQLNLSPSAESYLKYAITKEFLIFTIAWMGTRSIYVALTLTAAFIILSDYVFNDKSRFFMLPENFKKLQSMQKLRKFGKVRIWKSVRKYEKRWKSIRKWARSLKQCMWKHA